VTTNHPTQEAALAEAIAESVIGDVISVCEPHCLVRFDGDGNELHPCTCAPLVFVVRGAAA
jgi:hypothetical protein